MGLIKCSSESYYNIFIAESAFDGTCWTQFMLDYQKKGR